MCWEERPSHVKNKFLTERDILYLLVQNSDKSLMNWAQSIKIHGEKCVFKKHFYAMKTHTQQVYSFTAQCQ